METSLSADFSIVKGYKADEKGNVIFNKSARNFNIDAAKAGKICIVEVEEIVPTGQLDPELIQLPYIYVQRLIQCDSYQKRIEFRTVSVSEGDVDSAFSAKALNKSGEELNKAGMRRKRIAMRAARDITDGTYNLGIGIPTLITNFISK